MTAVSTSLTDLAPDFVPPKFGGQPRIVYLTPMQINVLESLCDGKTNRLIARDWGVAEDTIKSHVKDVYRKMKARDRLHAACLVYSGQVAVYQAPKLQI